MEVFWLRPVEDRATLGSDPSAAVCSERHDRSPNVEAGGLSGWSVLIMPVLPHAINPSAPSISPFRQAASSALGSQFLSSRIIAQHQISSRRATATMAIFRREGQP